MLQRNLNRYLLFNNFNTNSTMKKNNRKDMYTEKEEKQGRKVIMWIGIAAVALMVLMMVVFGYMG